MYFNSSDTVGGPTTISKIIPENNQVTIVNKVVSGESNRDLAYGYGAPYDSVRTIVGEIPRSKKNFKVKISMHDPSSYLKNEIEQLLNFEHQNINSIDRLDTLLIYKSPSLLKLLENVNKLLVESIHPLASVTINVYVPETSGFVVKDVPELDKLLA